MRGLTLALVVLCACGPTAPDMTSDSGSDSGTGDSEGTTTRGSATRGTTTAATGPDTTTTTTTTGGTTGGMVCAYQGQVRATVDIMPVPAELQADRDWKCFVEGVFGSESGYQAQLVCSGMNFDGIDANLLIHGQPQPQPPMWLAEGEVLGVRQVMNTPWWTEQWIRVEHGGQPVVAHVSAPRVASELLDPFEGLGVSVMESECEVLETDCGDQRRLTASLFDSLFELLSPGHSTQHPAYDVWFSGNRFVDDILCTDTPQQWVDLTIVAR